MKKPIFLAAVFLIALAGGYLALNMPGSGTNNLPALGAANAQTAEEIDTSAVQEMVLGAEDAPITMIEYASYTCPHCRRFHEGTFKELKADYIDTGKVRFIYREIYFDRFGLWASIIARCGEGDKFFGITDVIYAKQSEWAQGSPQEIVDNLRRIGLVAGLTADQVDQCMSDGDNAQMLYAWFLQNSEADEVQSTPSFIIDGQKHGNMSYDEMRAILDAKL